MAIKGQKPILIYSFIHKTKCNISSQVMDRLARVDKFAIDYTSNEVGLNDTNKLLKKIEKSHYAFIIGLGMYTSKSNNIKVERIARNKFRSNKAVKTSQEFYFVSEFLKSSENTQNIVESERMGNSWCNMTTFVIRHLIITKSIKSLNGFIHIPNTRGMISEFAVIVERIIHKTQI